MYLMILKKELAIDLKDMNLPLYETKFKIIKKIINRGHNVVTIDNLSTGNESNIPKGVDFIKGDCQSVEKINFKDGMKEMISWAKIELNE